MTAPGIHPRSVTPGIETQSENPDSPDPGVYVQLDWLRFTGPESSRPELEALAERWFGRESKRTGGAKYFASGETWEPGVQISAGHSADVCMIDVRGERLRLLSGDDQVRLACEIASLGMKPTRIDGAIDWAGKQVHVYDNAVGSCLHKQLCILRTFAPDPQYHANGVPMRKLLKLGQRESAVCARIYDKGLQTNTAPCQYWERLEVEWKDDRAMGVLMAIRDAGDDWPKVLTSLIVGAVDFRMDNGRSEFARRPRAAWWAELIAFLAPERSKPMDTESSFEKWTMAFRKSYGRRIAQMADAIGEPVEVVASHLLQHVSPSLESHPAVVEFASEWNASSRSHTSETRNRPRVSYRDA